MNSHIVIAHFRPDMVSGAEFAVADMLEKFNSRYRFTMLVPGEGRLAEYYRKRSFAVWTHKIQTPRRKYPGLHTIQSYLFARQLRSAGVAMTIANTFAAASRVGTACRFAGIPHAIYVREYIRDIPMHRAILSRADGIFAVSRDVANYVSSTTSGEKICVAHDYLNLESLDRRVVAARINPPSLPFAQKHPLVGIIGRITTYKQQDLFLRAIPLILAQEPDARFIVVGTATKREKPYEDSLRQLASDLRVDDKVAFLGHRPDALEIMTRLTVSCITSDREPFPRALLEAQLVGCPVVASDTGGCPEIVDHGVTGLLFSADSSDARENLAEGVIRLIKHREFAQTLAIHARRHIESTMASESPVRHLERAIEAILHAQK